MITQLHNHISLDGVMTEIVLDSEVIKIIILDVLFWSAIDSNHRKHAWISFELLEHRFKVRFVNVAIICRMYDLVW